MSIQKESALKNYRLAKWRWRTELHEKANTDEIKSLREEIGILRIVLEERLVQCRDPMDLILQSGPISELVMKIERVVTSCHKLEGSMGRHLDRQQLLQFADKIISVISQSVEDEVLLDSISKNILTLLAEDE